MKITYLFGAGASIGTIPAVKDFINGVKELLELLNEDKINKDLISTLNYLVKEIPNYASVDTLIRKLHIQNDPYALKLNAGLIAIIHFLQLTKNIDKRYDLFLGNLISIENGKIALPTNVNFISWNYDRLFETSLFSLIDAFGDLNIARSFLNIYNNYETIENETNPFLIKLNGSAGVFIDSQTKKSTIDKILNEVIFNYEGTVSNRFPNSTIQFAWDENENTKKCRLKAIEIMSATNILVVIGYSFPTFNRIIDRKILDKHHNLERIVVQNTKENIDSVCDRLIALVPKIEQKRIIRITDETEFHMPIEI